MRKFSISLILFVGLLLSCRPEAGSPPVDVKTNETENLDKTHEIQPMPTSNDVFDIHARIGIADVRDDGIGCLRTKNVNLSEKEPISIIVSLDQPKQKVINANIEKKLEQSCARRASETTDRNPGENVFYSLIVNDADKVDGFDVGIAVLGLADKVRLEDGLAQVDLDGDGKPEFFRSCTGFEGVLYTVWTGKPLIGKRIWHSFYYLDYGTEPDCKKKDFEGIDDDEDQLNQ